jgi:cholesterol transport system auxiliary component
MQTLKYTLYFILLWGLSGCGTSAYYSLSQASAPAALGYTEHRSIGVDKVTVPKYLFRRELATAESSHRIRFDAQAEWAEEMDEGLTRRLIAYIQRSTHNPRVYGYPWGMDRQPNLKIHVDITRFIARNGRVYLDASWYVEDMKQEKKRARLFSVSLPAGSDSESIVAAMDQAFAQLEAAIVKGLR